MQTVNILITGTNREILATVVRLVNSRPQWRGIGAATVLEALVQLQKEEIHLVLLGAGLTADEEAKLQDFCQSHPLKIPVVAHYGGGSGLLFGEIEMAIGKG